MEADAQVETRQSTDAITCSISSPVYIKEQRHKEMQIALEEYLRQNGYSDTDLEVVNSSRRANRSAGLSYSSKVMALL